MNEVILSTDIKELKKLFSGKVRDIYEINPREWLIVTTDRISAFDVVFNEGIPQKGLFLNGISNHWFSILKSIPNHIISSNPVEVLPFLKNYPGVSERSVIVKKLNRLPVECVVRGYLFGSAYDEYQVKQSACGIKLPAGMAQAEKLPQPIFTPASKAETGHDENIDYGTFVRTVGKEVGDAIMDAAIEIYETARDKMSEKGILLADTKFEFGLDEAGKLILVDEVLTPDSSRYWEKESYKVGESPKSYDKQFVRDYLNQIKWNKQPPAPALPQDIIMKTREKYEQIASVIATIR